MPPDKKIHFNYKTRYKLCIQIVFFINRHIQRWSRVEREKSKKWKLNGTDSVHSVIKMRFMFISLAREMCCICILTSARTFVCSVCSVLCIHFCATSKLDKMLKGNYSANNKVITAYTHTHTNTIDIISRQFLLLLLSSRSLIIKLYKLNK